MGYPTENTAYGAAKRISRKHNDDRFVVFDNSLAPSHPYHVTDEHGVDTFYYGCRILAVYRNGRWQD